MKIPKIIHYCWFGPKPIPKLELKCMESWKVFFPDYKFMFWNEKTFDINEVSFVKQAYETKHFAFVSDYVRTKVLYEYGGIYLDTDVEILQSFDRVLKKENCFLGFETRAKLGTALMGFTPQHNILNTFLTFYRDNNFINKGGDVNTIANVTILTDILSKSGLITNGTAQTINDIEVFPREYFYPKKISDIEFRITSETIAIHKCSNSWMTKRERNRGNNKIWINIMRPLLRSCRNFGLNAFGAERIQKIEIKIRNILK
jgi:mannosyltransferase OCH1-like enzyme